MQSRVAALFWLGAAEFKRQFPYGMFVDALDDYLAHIGRSALDALELRAALIAQGQSRRRLRGEKVAHRYAVAAISGFLRFSAGLHPADLATRGDEAELFTQAQGPDGKLLMPARCALLGSQRCSPH
jgi:hypothetical protein